MCGFHLKEVGWICFETTAPAAIQWRGSVVHISQQFPWFSCHLCWVPSRKWKWNLIFNIAEVIYALWYIYLRCQIVNTCDFMICITIAVTFVLVKRCFLIELIPSSSDERDAIQKKTFTKWVNKHLKKVTIDFYNNNVGMENKDIFRKASILMQFCKTMW